MLNQNLGNQSFEKCHLQPNNAAGQGYILPKQCPSIIVTETMQNS